MAENENSGVSPEQFQINHLARRYSQMVAEYELKLSASAVQVQVLSQELTIAQKRLEGYEAAEEPTEITADDLGPDPSEHEGDAREELPDPHSNRDD